MSETTLGSDCDHYNPYIQVFKCMGSQHDAVAQDTLNKVRELRISDIEVPVRLVPEPTNRFDSKAVAIQCQLQVDAKWVRIGYIGKEALDCVHSFMESNCIISVEFAWVKYVLSWPKSFMLESI